MSVFVKICFKTSRYQGANLLNIYSIVGWITIFIESDEVRKYFTTSDKCVWKLIDIP